VLDFGLNEFDSNGWWKGKDEDGTIEKKKGKRNTKISPNSSLYIFSINKNYLF